MTYNTPEQKKLRSILQRSGYDSILYPNAVENLYRTKPGVSPRLDNLMTNIQMRRADAAQSPDYNRQDRLDRKLEQAENLYSAGIGKNDNRSWIVLDPRDIRHQSALFNIDDMGSANLWKADGGMVEHHDAERLAAMHAALDREAALRGAHRYADGGSVEASEPEGIPVPPDLVPMLHEQLGLRFADGGAVDWSRYGEVPQTATPAAPDASSVAPVAAQQAQQQQQIDQYISNAMSPPRTQDAGDNYSAPPPGKSVIGEGYNNPAFWGGLIGSIAGPLGSTIGKSLGTVAGTQRANQDLLSLGVPNQVSYRDALVGANVPFGLGDTFGIGVSPQRSFTDIVTSQLMPDQYAEYVGRAQGNAPQGVGDIPGVTSDIAPGMGPPGSPGSDSWGGDSSGSDWSGGGGGASP
jgi:hypothetical protein